jgi:arylsulfatase A-like enzyme
MGDLDNTLVIFIWGDNGASMEGTLTGSFNEWTMINGLPLTDEQQLQLVLKWGALEAWGTELMAPHYSAAWAWAGDCPFQWASRSPRTSAAPATRWSSDSKSLGIPRRRPPTW